MKEIIKRIIFENQEFACNIELTPRNFTIEENANYVFVGSRRAGKSYFMYQTIQSLLVKGIDREQILFINFEDERLTELRAQDLDIILEAYKELFEHTPVLFFDEIQNIKGWEKFVRRLADRKSRVFVTGSNAQMLSREVATVLGGRFLVKEIHTLSFTEYLLFQGIVPEKSYQYKEQRFELKRKFEQYFYYGAYPETNNFQHKKEYLSNLYQKVFYGDVVARHNIKNDFALKLLMKKLAESTTDETSFNRLRHLIKSAGVGIGTSTLIEYFHHLENSFLAYGLSNYKAKFAERESKKKFYFNDNGILGLFLLEPEAQLCETLVFNYLRRKYGEEVYYYRNNVEVDFYIPKKELIQVAYSMQRPETRKREFDSLVKIAAEVEVPKHTVLTYSDEEQVEHQGKKISVVPLWQWCLAMDNA